MFKELESKLGENIDIGNLNVRTPLIIFLNDYCQKTINDLLYHKELFIVELKKQCSVFLLKDYLIITKIINDKITVSVDDDIIIYKISYKNIFGKEFSKFSLGYHYKLKIIKNNYLNEFNEITISITSEEEYFILNHFIEKEIYQTWQKFFESNCVKTPHVYNAHFFIHNKHYEISQEKIILLTDRFLLEIYYSLNVPKNTLLYPISLQIKNINRALAISSFESITILSKDISKNEYVLNIIINNKTNEEIVTRHDLPFKKKTELKLRFCNLEDFNYFITSIKRLFFNQNNKQIQLSIK